MLDLDTIFGDDKTPPAVTTTTAAATAPVQPELVHSGDGRPDDLGGDLLPADGEWDELPSPTPCAVCGEILASWGLWGERRCAVCEPSGQRSTELAERAARLRAANSERKAVKR